MAFRPARRARRPRGVGPVGSGPGSLLQLSDRDRALGVQCPVARCRAPIDVECRSLATGRPLGKVSAHVARLTLAGVDIGRSWLADVSRETSSEDQTRS